jgi:transposase
MMNIICTRDGDIPIWLEMATNILDVKALSADDALKNDKGQQGTERGFRFLKDPLFFASSVFLKVSLPVGNESLTFSGGFPV